MLFTKKVHPHNRRKKTKKQKGRLVKLTCTVATFTNFFFIRTQFCSQISLLFFPVCFLFFKEKQPSSSTRHSFSFWDLTFLTSGQIFHVFSSSDFDILDPSQQQQQPASFCVFRVSHFITFWFYLLTLLISKKALDGSALNLLLIGQ